MTMFRFLTGLNREEVSNELAKLVHAEEISGIYSEALSVGHTVIAVAAQEELAKRGEGRLISEQLEKFVDNTENAERVWSNHEFIRALYASLCVQIRNHSQSFPEEMRTWLPNYHLDDDGYPVVDAKMSDEEYQKMVDEFLKTIGKPPSFEIPRK